MKKTFKSILYILLAATFVATSCKDKNDEPAPSNNNSGLEIIEGEISSSKILDASKKYLLKGKVYVLSGNTITIPAGTIIFGDKTTQGALVINRGAKIMAEGTASNPIVFTSNAPAGFRQRGDWAGIVICGNAQTNKGTNNPIEGIQGTGTTNGYYGPGTALDNSQNSGIMKYVRIEYAGFPLSDDNELNSLTLGSIGSGTAIDNIMVSYANDDAYEWFGGTVNHKFLIAYSTNDDDFDTDAGYSGSIQYGLIVRDNNIADKSTSRAFEASSNSAGVDPDSECKFANFTILGPWVYADTSTTTNIAGSYGNAIEINSSSNIKVWNSIVLGFTVPVNMNGGDNSEVKNNILYGRDSLVSKTAAAKGTFSNNTVITSRVLKSIYGTSVFTGKDSKKNKSDASSALYFNNPNPLQVATSPYVTGAPDLSASGLTTEAYYGAFGTTANAGWAWGQPWINFQPQNTAY
jgi:hypothetical protein